jgi:hypothetical protein
MIRLNNGNSPNTKRHRIQLSHANPENNILADSKTNIFLYPRKKIQKNKMIKSGAYLFTINDHAASSEHLSTNNGLIIQLLKLCLQL